MDRFRRMDADLVAREQWEWDPIEWSPGREWYTWARTGLRHRVAQQATETIGARRVPYRVAVAAFHRLHAELVECAARKAADLYYGGAGGALAAVALAAARHRVQFAVDVEDFHTGEVPEKSTRHTIIERVETSVLGDAALVTAGSPAIADAYRRKYGVRPVAICNTFPLPPLAPALEPRQNPGLRLYWFSQTIGPGRGLETVVDALALGEVHGELHLRGAVDAAYAEALRQRIAPLAPRLRIELHPVESPERMIDLCRDYDVGLAPEPCSSMNNGLILSNKALTYPLAGLALVLTDTAGHRPLIADLGADAIVYKPGDVEALARGLKTWSADKAALRRAMAASWRAATGRWHWDGQDREALLSAVGNVFN